MKLKLLIALSVLLLLLIAVAIWWDPIIDALPIDQSGWKNTEQGWLHLDEDGDPLTGWQTIDGNTYYFDLENGTMFTGLCPIDLATYYFDEQGIMQTGWIGSSYFTAEGSMAVGFHEIDGRTHYFHADGTPASGWTEIDGIDRYFSESGTPLSGWLDIDGQHLYLSDDGSAYTGWLELDGNRYYLTETGMAIGWCQTDKGLFYMDEEGHALSGWLDLNGSRYFIGEDGVRSEGWNDIEGKRYYMNPDGSIRTRWLELDGKKYYLKEDGTAAIGKLIIDGETHYFTSTGTNIVLVNPWNYLSDEYTVELTKLDNGHTVATEMVDALMQMLADCEAAGHKPYLYSSYRTASHQQRLFNNMVNNHGGDRAKAARIVAVPGTSEHQLGLAVDITDFSFRELNSKQEKTDTQKWLMEHCWDYGFILRYPNSKSTITGIIYEPWHYRYVGLELAAELKDSGICLEEYLDQLTNDGTTCGGGKAS